MNRKINGLFILALGISTAFIACNGGDTKEAATTDSVSTTKTDTVQQMAQDATADAIKAAPNLYKLISDTMGIRVLEATYKPGDSSAMHSHPDYALYVINGGTSAFTEKDGTKQTHELKTGMSMIAPGGTHSVKNIGKTTTKVLIVEVNRPAK